MEKEADCIVHGKVQNVGYRLYVAKRAKELNLCGYVENEEDGTVNVVVQGKEEKIEELIEYLKEGPYFSRVDDVYISWSDTLQDALTDFSIK